MLYRAGPLEGQPVREARESKNSKDFFFPLIVSSHDAVSFDFNHLYSFSLLALTHLAELVDVLINTVSARLL